MAFAVLIFSEGFGLKLLKCGEQIDGYIGTWKAIALGALKKICTFIRSDTKQRKPVLLVCPKD